MFKFSSSTLAELIFPQPAFHLLAIDLASRLQNGPCYRKKKRILNLKTNFEQSLRSLFRYIFEKVAFTKMSDYKVAERIALLTENERKTFRRLLRDTSNAQQLRMYDALLKQVETGQPVDKTKVFQRVFDEPWSLNKDYLLRNSFRLLTDALEAFLQHEIADAALDNQQQLLLLGRLSTAQQYSEFNQRLSLLLKQAYLENNFGFVADLLRLQQQQAPHNVQLLEQEREARIRQHQQQEAEWHLRYSIATTVDRTTHLPVPETPAELDSVTVFFNDMSGMYRLEAMQKVQQAVLLLGRLDGLQSPLIDRAALRFTLLFEAGTGYLSTAAWPEASAMFARLAAQPAIENQWLFPQFLLHYSTALMRQERYPDVVELIRKHPLAAAHKRSNNLLRLREAVALLFLNETNAAGQLISELTPQLKDQHLLFARAIWICCCIAQHHPETALEELKQLAQGRQMRRPTAEPYKVMFDFFRQFLRLSLRDADGRKQLQAALAAAWSANDALEFLPLHWLDQYAGLTPVVPLFKR